jgi:hypothetical protein
MTINYRRQPEYISKIFESFYEGNQQILESFNKPIIITETSTQDTDNPQDKADWVNSMFEYAKSNPKITALVWFNSIHEMRYDTSQQSIQAFKQNLTALNKGSN